VVKCNRSAGDRMAMTLALSMLTMKTLETVAREIERQMYGQWNHCAIYESDLQRLCPHTGLTEMARAKLCAGCGQLFF
jgi:hypothetical protein